MNRVTDKSRMKGRFLIALAPMLLASTLAVAMIGLATLASAQSATPETTITILVPSFGQRRTGEMPRIAPRLHDLSMLRGHAVQYFEALLLRI